MDRVIFGYLLFTFQLLAHIGLVWFLFNMSFATVAIVLFIYFLTGGLGVSVTYHRLLSHKSWNAPLWWRYVGSLLGFWALIGSPLAWANNHIAHHRYVDTAKDPHSPKIYPWWKVQWLSMLTSYPSFRFAASNMTKFQMFLHRYYFHLHILILISLISVFGLWVTVVVYLAPAAVTWNMAGLINTLNHSNFGYKTYDTPDSSVNNIFSGIFVFGEGWHNNHHRFPGRAKFGEKWWELDIGAIAISLLKR